MWHTDVFTSLRVEYGYVGFALAVEVEGGCLGDFSYGIAHCCHEDLPDHLLVLKFYLGLDGMDIDIDVLGVDGEVDEIGHLVAIGQKTVEGCEDCLMEIGMLHIAPVNEEILVEPLAAGRLGFAYEA